MRALRGWTYKRAWNCLLRPHPLNIHCDGYLWQIQGLHEGSLANDMSGMAPGLAGFQALQCIFTKQQGQETRSP